VVLSVVVLLLYSNYSPIVIAPYFKQYPRQGHHATLVELWQKLRIPIHYICFRNHCKNSSQAKHDPYHDSTSVLKLNTCISIRFKASRVTTETAIKATLTMIVPHKITIRQPKTVLFAPFYLLLRTRLE
jgi:hypothetical protein